MSDDFKDLLSQMDDEEPEGERGFADLLGGGLPEAPAGASGGGGKGPAAPSARVPHAAQKDAPCFNGAPQRPQFAILPSRFRCAYAWKVATTEPKRISSPGSIRKSCCGGTRCRPTSV